MTTDVQRDYVLPEGCPKEGCPKEGAVAVDRRIWRIVKTSPPTLDDFKNYLELGLRPSGDECLRCGVSVQISAADARHQQELFPYLGDFIASAELTPDRGKLKQTRKPPHHTWWPDERIPRYQGFQVE